MQFEQFKAMVEYEDIFGIPDQTTGKQIGISPDFKTFSVEQQLELIELVSTRPRILFAPSSPQSNDSTSTGNTWWLIVFLLLTAVFI